mgnify:FL=1
MDRNSYTNKLSFENADESVKMTIDSKCPDKWLFVDLETGDIWHYSPMGRYKMYSAPKEKIAELKDRKSVV